VQISKLVFTRSMPASLHLLRSCVVNQFQSSVMTNNYLFTGDCYLYDEIMANHRTYQIYFP